MTLSLLHGVDTLDIRLDTFIRQSMIWTCQIIDWPSTEEEERINKVDLSQTYL